MIWLAKQLPILLAIASIVGFVVTWLRMVRKVEAERVVRTPDEQKKSSTTQAGPGSAAAAATGGTTAAALRTSSERRDDDDSDPAPTAPAQDDTASSRESSESTAVHKAGMAAAAAAGAAGIAASSTKKVTPHTTNVADGDDVIGSEGAAAGGVTYDEGRYGAGSVNPLPGGAMPVGFSIKGNEQSKLYHTLESPQYSQTKAEVWFKDESTAQAAGFTRWDAARTAQESHVEESATEAGATATATATANLAGAPAASAPGLDDARHDATPSPTTADSRVSDDVALGEADSSAASEEPKGASTTPAPEDTSDSASGNAALAAGLVGTAAAGSALSSSGYPEGKYGPGSVDPLPDHAQPEGYDIKGNAQSMLFHTPQSPSYKVCIAEVWFKDEESAKRAGFKHWDRKKREGVAAVVAAAAISYPEGSYGPGSVDPLPDNAQPEGYDIKGNAQSMLFHTPQSPSYKVCIAEVWFKDEESAKRAGFKHWDRKKRGL